MQQEPSTVITVLPAGQAVNKITPQKHIVHSGGGFQQISQGVYTNGKKVISNSTGPLKSDIHIVQGKTFTEQRQITPQPCTVYTVSRNMAGEKTFSRVNSTDVIHMPTIVQKHPGSGHLQGSSSSKTTEPICRLQYSDVSQPQTATAQMQNSRSATVTTVRTASFQRSTRDSPSITSIHHSNNHTR